MKNHRLMFKISFVTLLLFIVASTLLVEYRVHYTYEIRGNGDIRHSVVKFYVRVFNWRLYVLSLSNSSYNIAINDNYFTYCTAKLPVPARNNKNTDFFIAECVVKTSFLVSKRIINANFLIAGDISRYFLLRNPDDTVMVEVSEMEYERFRR